MTRVVVVGFTGGKDVIDGHKKSRQEQRRDSRPTREFAGHSIGAMFQNEERNRLREGVDNPVLRDSGAGVNDSVDSIMLNDAGMPANVDFQLTFPLPRPTIKP